MKYKIGDRVRSISWAKPSTGTIKKVYETSYTVELDAKEIPTHSAWQENGKFYIFHSDHELEPIERKANVFQIGDRIRVTNMNGFRDEGHHQNIKKYIGEVGTIDRQWNAPYEHVIVWDSPKMQAIDDHNGHLCLQSENIQLVGDNEITVEEALEASKKHLMRKYGCDVKVKGYSFK